MTPRGRWGVALFAVILAVVSLAKSSVGPAAPSGPVGSSARPVMDAYRQRCRTPQARTGAECIALRASVRFRTLRALWTLEWSEDKRSVAAAAALLALDGEPAIQLAALRVARRDPRHPGVAAQAFRLLVSPYPGIQEEAAHIVRAAGDERQRWVAEQWQHGHPTRGHDDPHFPAAAPAPPDLGRLGFALYPRAGRFPPADAPNAVGWATPDPLDQVVEFYTRQAGQKPVDVTAWRQLRHDIQNASIQKLATDISSDPDVQELQRLAKEFERTQDPKAIQKMQELSERMEKRMKAREAAHEARVSPVFEVRTPPGAANGTPHRTARFFVTSPAAGQVSRVVVVYTDDAVGQTIIQMAWAG